MREASRSSGSNATPTITVGQAHDPYRPSEPHQRRRTRGRQQHQPGEEDTMATLGEPSQLVSTPAFLSAAGPSGRSMSNRSSPERSPERKRRLRPMTAATGQDPSTSNGRRSPADGLHRNGRPASPPPSETPVTLKLSYFGSNESERDSTLDGDDEGNASSSDDSVEIERRIDEALHSEGTPPAPGNGTGAVAGFPGRTRELLVQRPAHDQGQTLAQQAWQWEQAFSRQEKQKRSSPRPKGRSSPNGSFHAGSEHNGVNGHANARRQSSGLLEGVSFGAASRRRGSPSSFDNGHRPEMKRTASPQPLSVASALDYAAPDGGGKGFPFRLDLLPEVSLLTGALVYAAYRLENLPPSSPIASKLLDPIPISPLIMLIIAIPCISLFRPRSKSPNYMFPFTDERGYRTPSTTDDGFAAGATIPVLLSAAFLWDALVRGQEDDPTLGGVRLLTEVWQAAGLMPPEIPQGEKLPSLHDTIVVSRISLLLSTSINSFVLMLHILLSRTVLKVERLPTSNTKRFFGALALSSSVSFFLWALLALNHRFAWATPYVSPLEAGISSLIYQMSMYTVSRLVRRGFTLGELALATGSGISLCLEFWRLTLSRIFYTKSGMIPYTFRIPTPLVPFQHVLIPGAFLTGFLLSPLLILSRYFAQMPSHRLKKPGERGRNRRLLAAGVFQGMLLIVVLPFGGWAGWTLGGGLTSSWTWAMRFALFGGDGVDGMHSGEFRGWRRWKRVALVLYWLGIAVSAVGGWQTRLVRARRIRLAKSRKAKDAGAESANLDFAHSVVSSKAQIEAVGVSNIREDRRMHVALDLRRKFFHALAVLMFLPAIAIDPAFTSLAFSLAFAIFTFAEYARYFAVYPIGVPIHVFFNEFIDSKDAGPVILSHFYLLTGCAGGLWLESKGIKIYSGLLAVGVGDAFASVLGRRLGKRRWPGSTKTYLGTFAFIVSVFASAMALRASGVVEHFSATRYLVATILAGLLEAMSMQNDNLLIPIYFWSILSLSGC